MAPNDMTSYLSKLFIVLREATQSKLKISQDALDTHVGATQGYTQSQIGDYEGSLAAMQTDNDELFEENTKFRRNYDKLVAQHKKKVEEVDKKEKVSREAHQEAIDKLVLEQKRHRAIYEQRSHDYEQRQHELEMKLTEQATVERISVPKPVSNKREREETVENLPRADMREAKAAKRNSTRRSAASSALKNILALNADTPTGRVALPLAAKDTVTQKSASSKVQGRSLSSKKTSTVATTELVSASEQVKSRVQQAIAAARAKSSGI